MNKSNSSQTAYAHNSVSDIDASTYRDHGWAETINRMIGKRYSFLPEQYRPGQYLFRGMSGGLLQAVLTGSFWHFDSSMHVASFEQEENILCVSQDFSDAYSVARLWEHPPEAGILIIKSQVFNDRLSERSAAMLATAEPGVLFRYPFFTVPLQLNDVEKIIVSPSLLTAVTNNQLTSVSNDFTANEIGLVRERLQELASSNTLLGCAEIRERAGLEQQLTELLVEQGMTAASITRSELMPSKT